MGLCLETTSRAEVADYSPAVAFFDPFAWSHPKSNKKIEKAMTQFKIHHDVSELVKLLGVADERKTADVYVDILLKNKIPHTNSQVGSVNVVRKLAEQSPSSQDFLNLYENLRGKNVRNLNAVACLLSKIGEDSQMRNFLEKNAQQRSFKQETEDSNKVSGLNINKSGKLKLTSKELTKLRDQLLKETSETTSNNIHSDTDYKRKTNANIPSLPAWISERPYLTLDFIPAVGYPGSGSSLGPMPLATQEHVLLEDMLYCLSGIDGNFIMLQPETDRHSDRSFILDESIDSSLKEMVKRMLPICCNYSTVVRFIEEKSAFDAGLVNHALSAAMRNLIKDHLLLVAQLETQLRQGLLTFQKLWFYLQPTKHILDILASLSNSILKSSCKGGAVLNILHERMANLSGDLKAQELCLFLMQNASVPYFEILEKWIYKGVISDLYNEFLVEDNEVVKKEDLPTDYSNDYWEKRYTICSDRIPGFLKKVADMILRTGKYLNVIRQCGKDIHCPCAEEIVFSSKECDYVACIEKAYDFASRKLLDLLVEQSDLMGHLRSVKHYFLLDQGDFIVQFMDMAEDELKKNIDDIMPTRLESLLGLALRTSVANTDPYNDDVRVELLPYDLMTQMFKILSIETEDEKNYQLSGELNLLGLEAFSFAYEVRWPLSLVLNKKALACYQMLFRHLFYAKHVERLLYNVWISNRVAKSFPLTDARSYGAAFALRQRMLNFVQNLQYYMMFEVLEPNWNTFLSRMQTVGNVDDVLNYHLDFLNVCLKDCMLTCPSLLKMTDQLMKICITFCTFIQKMNRYSIEAEMTGMTQSIIEQEETEEQSPDSDIHPMAMGESYEQRIDRFDKEFTDLLIFLLDRISDIGQENYNDKLVNILYRLDFNGFYSQKLEFLSMERSLMIDRSTNNVTD